MRARKTSSIALLVLLACDRAGAARPDAAQAPAPTAPAAEGAGGGGQKASREALVKAALKRVGEVSDQLAALRGLPFKRKVEAVYQSQEDFRKFVKKEIQTDLPPAKAKGLSRSLSHLGILKEPLDLLASLEDALVSQAGAYYDPQSKKFYIVMVPEQQLMLDTLSAHELTHALQDQYFDLIGYYGGKGNAQKLSDDTLNARRFIVEGEATLTMTAYQMQAATGGQTNLLDPKAAPAARMTLQAMARMDMASVTSSKKAEMALYADMGPDIQKAMAAMEKIPPYILQPLVDSYLKGALPVYEAYARGSWAAVKRLYDDPPDSTEQVLHPADKLVGKRDYPQKIVLPPPAQLGKAFAGGKEILADVAGELLLRVYLSNWSAPDVEPAAAGWDGDRWAVWDVGGKTIGAWVSTWDSEADAQEFAKAYVSSLDRRFPGAPTTVEGGASIHARTDGGVVAAMVKGADVFVVSGVAKADAAGALAELVKGTKKVRDPRDK